MSRMGSLPQSQANMLSLTSQQQFQSSAQPPNLMPNPSNVTQPMGMLHQPGTLPNGSMPPNSSAAAAAAAAQQQRFQQMGMGMNLNMGLQAQQQQQHHNQQQQQQQQQQQRAMMMRQQSMGPAGGGGMGGVGSGASGAGMGGTIGQGTAGGVGVGAQNTGGAGAAGAGGPPQINVTGGLSQQSLLGFTPSMMGQHAMGAGVGAGAAGAGGANVPVRRVTSQPHPTGPTTAMGLLPQHQASLLQQNSARQAQQYQLQMAALRPTQPHPTNPDSFMMGLRPNSSQNQLMGGASGAGAGLGAGGAAGMGGTGTGGAGGAAAHPHPSQPNPFQNPHNPLMQPPPPSSQTQHQPGNMNVAGPSQSTGLPGRGTPDNQMSFQNSLFQPPSMGQSFAPFNPSAPSPTQHQPPDRSMSHPANLTGGYVSTPLQESGASSGGGPGPTGMSDQPRFDPHLGMPPPLTNSSSGPPRPPSMAPPGPATNPRLHSPHQHASPQPPLVGDNYPPRPQSVPRPSSQDVSMGGAAAGAGGVSRTPRAAQMQLPNQPPRGVTTGMGAGGVVNVNAPGSGGGGMPMQPSSGVVPPQPPTNPSAVAHAAMVQGVGGVGMMGGGGMRPPVPPTMQSTSAPSSTTSSSETIASNDSNMPMGRPMAGPPLPPHLDAFPIGDGQGLVKLLHFSGMISSEVPAKFSLKWWEQLVDEFFTRKSSFRFTLWKDNEQTEAKPFEIGVPVLPRFFLITTQAGVKSMSLTLDGARERIWSPGHSVVECVTAAWTWRYTNGHSVTLRGPLTCHLILCTVPTVPNPHAAPPYMIKIDQLQFDATSHEKHIALDAISGPRVQMSPAMLEARVGGGGTIGAGGGSLSEEERRWEEPRVTIERANMPGEPVNAFGIPQATMRCLELAESVSAMSDLITFSTENGLGPRDALEKFATNLKKSMLPISHLPPNSQAHLGQQMPYPMTGLYSSGSNPLNPMEPTISLYTPLQPTSSAPTPSASSPQAQNMPSSATNSPQKQSKTIPSSTQHTPAAGTASIPVTPTATAATPPSSAAAAVSGTNKRKQAAPAEDSGKRPARRRRN